MTNEESFPGKLEDLEVILKCKECGMKHNPEAFGPPGRCVYCHTEVKIEDHYQMGECFESIKALGKALETAKAARDALGKAQETAKATIDALRKALKDAIAEADRVKLPFEVRLEPKEQRGE
jgi:hypothetical protein